MVCPPALSGQAQFVKFSGLPERGVQRRAGSINPALLLHEIGLRLDTRRRPGDRALLRRAPAPDLFEDLVALGRVLWENGQDYFQPYKVFIRTVHAD